MEFHKVLAIMNKFEIKWKLIFCKLQGFIFPDQFEDIQVTSMIVPLWPISSGRCIWKIEIDFLSYLVFTVSAPCMLHKVKKYTACEISNIINCAQLKSGHCESKSGHSRPFSMIYLFDGHWQSVLKDWPQICYQYVTHTFI